MSLPKNVIRLRNFAYGELDEEAERRDDTDLLKSGLKRALNVRAMETGALTRRPGRKVAYFDSGRHDIVRISAGVEFRVTFKTGAFVARSASGAIVTEITGCPWTADMIADLVWDLFVDRIIVCHRDMPPQVLSYSTVTGAWTRAAFAFRQTLGGGYRAPFWRFSADGVTMQPSARTGSITVIFSDDVLEAGHAGILFTWGGRQLRIDTVTDAQNATATVIEKLPPTFDVTVGSIDGFLLGETVEGDVSGATGEIVAITAGGGNSGTLTIVCVENFSGFIAGGSGDKVIGQVGSGNVTAVSEVSPGAATTWEEQFMSELRGWPGSCSSDVQRAIFCDFPQFESAIIWSAINAEDDLLISGQADGAIFEYVPQGGRVLFVAGGADEFVLTDIGIYYIPISGSNPLVPGSVEFRRIGSDGSDRVKPVAVADGLVFVSRSKTRLFAIVATGQTAQPYIVQAITEFHSHLFNQPVALAASDGGTLVPGRHIYVVNTDGTVVVGRATASDMVPVGWFPWESQGVVNDVAARYGAVVFGVTYTLDSGTLDTVETVDDTAKLDGQIDLSNFQADDPIELSDGSPLEMSTEEDIHLSQSVLLPFAGATLSAYTDDGFFIEAIEVDEDGAIDLTGIDSNAISLGWSFGPEVTPFLESFEGGQAFRQRLQRRKPSKVMLTMRNTTVFYAGGRSFAGYAGGEDWGAARPQRDATYWFRPRGRSFDPEITITQPTPGEFTLLEITIEGTI